MCEDVADAANRLIDRVAELEAQLSQVQQANNVLNERVINWRATALLLEKRCHTLGEQVRDASHIFTMLAQYPPRPEAPDYVYKFHNFVKAWLKVYKETQYGS